MSAGWLARLYRGNLLAMAMAFPAALCASGCGPSAALLRASDTVAAASSAVDEAGEEISRGEAEAPSGAVDRARGGHGRATVRLRDAEEVLRLWREEGTGKIGWATVAPCLAASLDGLTLLLEAAGLEVPTELPQATVVVGEVNGDRCPSEPRPSAPGQSSTESGSGNGD